MQSGLKLYSLGIVLVAKVRGSDKIIVDPIEHLSLDNGVLSEDSLDFKTELKDRQGVTRSTQLKGGSAIEAKWTPWGASNRETPPDVQPGETVLIFEYADTSEYYWVSIFREPSLRRLETVRYVFSNQPDGQKPYDENSSYWLEVSTHDQSIHLHTSTNNGEVAGYDIIIDTEAGTLTIQDDMDNSLVLNSTEGSLKATIREEIELNTKRFKLNATESTGIETDAFTIQAVSYLLQALQTFKLSAPGAIIGGGDDGGAGGRARLEGGLEIEGDVSVEGNIDATGTVMDQGGNSNHHEH